MLWLVVWACTAIPFFSSPFLTACLCSLILIFNVLLVSPMYNIPYGSLCREPGRPLPSSSLHAGTFCFTSTSSCFSVVRGLKIALPPRGAHAFSIFSLWPCTYMMWSVFGCSSSPGGCSHMHCLWGLLRVFLTSFWEASGFKHSGKIFHLWLLAGVVTDTEGSVTHASQHSC